MRIGIRRLTAGLGLGLLGLALPAAAAVPAAATVRLYGTEYESLAAVAGQFGLACQWAPEAGRARLVSAWTAIEAAKDSREITVNGLRVFLGSPLAATGRGLYVGRLDAEKLLAPILAPRTGGPAPRLRTIVVDPGHGGHDHGAANPALHLEEKRLTLDVARRVKRLLEADRYHVILTRRSDRYVALERRAELANRAGADLFVSIHFNAAGSGGAQVRGVETYTMTPRSQASTQAEMDRDMIGQEYPGNRNDFWNAVLGYQMHRQLVAALKSGDRGLKRRRLAVLRAVQCPAVLVEPGYLSNRAEGERLHTPAYRQTVAEAVVAGVRAYARVLEPVR